MDHGTCILDSGTRKGKSEEQKGQQFGQFEKARDATRASIPMTYKKWVSLRLSGGSLERSFGIKLFFLPSPLSWDKKVPGLTAKEGQRRLLRDRYTGL